MSMAAKLREHQETIAFIVLGMLLLSRFPFLWEYPRFWAEEAIHYFHYALTHSTFDTLTKAHQGYYSFIPTFATWLATFVPLAQAPYVTQLVALTVQLAPIGILMFGRFAFLPLAWHRMFAATCILFVGHTDEIWLNSITSQFHLTLVLFLLLVMEMPRTPLKRGLYVAMFALCGLSSVTACLLMPLALLRAREDRLYKLACIALAGACVLQLYTVLGVDHGPRRFQHSMLSLMAQGLNQTFASIWSADPHIMGMILRVVGNQFASSAHVISIITCFLAGLWLLAGVLIWEASSVMGRFHRICFFYGFFVILFVSLISSIGGIGGLRYTYVPSSILMLLIISVFALKHSKVAALLIAWALIVWLPVYYFKHCCHSILWPHWSEEVERYKRGETGSVTVHPFAPDQVLYMKLPPL